SILDGNATIGFLDPLDDGSNIHRAESSEIDHLCFDPLLGKLIGGGKRIVHADPPGNDRHMLSRPSDSRLADWHDPIVELRHFEALAVENLVLEKDHRIGIAD